MHSKPLFIAILAFSSLMMLTACPQDDPASTDGANTQMSDTGGPTGDIAPPEGEPADEGVGLSDEPAPILWKVAGLEEGTPLSLAAGGENVLTLKFEFAEGCHYNEETPLELRATAPEGITVTPDALAYAKPEEVPEEFAFKVEGLNPGSTGTIDLDLVAFFCSDEGGFCMRKMDTISLEFTAGGAESASYSIIYPLDPDL
jgi:hypothetical protein